MSVMIEFRYGAIAPPLEEQANQQGFTLGEKIEYFEKLRESISRLMFANIITDSQTGKAYEKLHKLILKNLKEI